MDLIVHVHDHLYIYEILELSLIIVYFVSFDGCDIAYVILLMIYAHYDGCSCMSFLSLDVSLASHGYDMDSCIENDSL